MGGWTDEWMGEKRVGGEYREFFRVVLDGEFF